MKFLEAEWRKLAIINYEINPRILTKYLPEGTVLDLYQDKCYISLVGFMFLNTKLLGLSIPYHKNFEEVNLRFYVKKKERNEWKRGVVFIKEIVPKYALTIVANSIYNENYKTMKMRNHFYYNENDLQVKYSWKDKEWYFMEITAERTPRRMEMYSEFEFITEHYWGFTKKGHKTSVYEVCHPKWEWYKVKSYHLEIDFKKLYGKDFECLNNQKPVSVMLAEGSGIEVKTKNYLSKCVTNDQCNKIK